LGALAARLVEDVDQMGPHVEQAQLEHGEQAARASPDDEHIGLDGFVHSSHYSCNLDLGCRRSLFKFCRRLSNRAYDAGKGVGSVMARIGQVQAKTCKSVACGRKFTFASYACRSGILTTSPSSASVTLIWQDRRELGRTS